MTGAWTGLRAQHIVVCHRAPMQIGCWPPDQSGATQRKRRVRQMVKVFHRLALKGGHKNHVFDDPSHVCTHSLRFRGSFSRSKNDIYAVLTKCNCVSSSDLTQRATFTGQGTGHVSPYVTFSDAYTRKKRLRDTFARCLFMDTSEKPPHEGVKTF